MFVHLFIQAFFLLVKQVWTQKCAVQKASVDVNISYYNVLTFKKKNVMDTANPGLLFLLKVRSCVLFQIFINS